MKFKFNHILVILVIFFFGIVFWKFFDILSFSDQTLSFERDSKQEKLYADSPIIQKLTITENNFNQINASIGKFSPKTGDKIILEVTDEFCKSILAKSSIGKLSWNHPGYEKFGFKTIPDSKNKTYCLKFTYIPNKQAQDKKVYMSSHAKEGYSYINTGKSPEEQKNRALEIKPAYENGSNWQNFSQLINRMSQYKPDYLKGIFLLTIFTLSIILITIVAISVIFI